MEIDIYKGKANSMNYEEYIDFINYVFGMNGYDISFAKLLPKIYKEKYHPCDAAYIVKEDSKIRAAVGAFPVTINVDDTNLKGYGIGNVAVHPNSRAKGYMKDLMKLEIDEIITNDADFMFLCGLRQRYNYFSFETCGQLISYNVNTTNIRHAYGGKDENSPMTFIQVKEDDIGYIRNIYDLFNKRKFHAFRSFDSFFDILVSWQSIPFIAFEKDKFAGYVVYNQDKSSVIEFNAVSPDYIDEMIKKCFEISGLNDFVFNFPPFDTEYIAVFSKIAEKCSVVPAGSFSVINYKRVIEAFLKLKASNRNLCDGAMILLIHGVAGDECLEIKISEGFVSVVSSDKNAEFELTHLEAMELLFCEISLARDQIPAVPASWLPLPIFNFSLDNV